MDKQKDLTNLFELPQLDLPEEESKKNVQPEDSASSHSEGDLDPISFNMETSSLEFNATSDPIPTLNSSFSTESSQDFSLENQEISSFSPEAELASPLVSESPVMDRLQSYHEKVQEKAFDLKAFHSFDLLIVGTFGVYERDQLLQFISKMESGFTSDVLDLQIQSQRVFFPRISESAGIQIIQKLMDSDLEFSLTPSSVE